MDITITITDTQNKCLEKFIAHCKNKNLKFNHILDIGAWVGTWSVAMNSFCGRVVAFEPDPVHYQCLVKNVPDDVVYYKYENGYPHHGTGKWVSF